MAAGCVLTAEESMGLAAWSNFCLLPDKSEQAPVQGKAAIIAVILTPEFTCFSEEVCRGLEANELQLKQGELCSYFFGSGRFSSSVLGVIQLFCLALGPQSACSHFISPRFLLASILLYQDCLVQRIAAVY